MKTGCVMHCWTVTHRLTVILDFVMELIVDVLRWDDSHCLPAHLTKADQAPRACPHPPSLWREAYSNVYKALQRIIVNSLKGLDSFLHAAPVRTDPHCPHETDPRYCGSYSVVECAVIGQAKQQSVFLQRRDPTVSHVGHWTLDNTERILQVLRDPTMYSAAPCYLSLSRLSEFALRWILQRILDLILHENINELQADMPVLHWATMSLLGMHMHNCLDRCHLRVLFLIPGYTQLSYTGLIGVGSYTRSYTGSYQHTILRH